MKPLLDRSRDSRSIGQQQQRFQHEEFRSSVRALLMTPLMSREHDDFPAIRRQAEALRDWFARETGWPLQIEHEGARLFKRPADLASCLDMITGSAARLMRLDDYGITVGGPADLVCVDASNPADAVATLAQPLWGIKRGRASFTRPRPQLHPRTN